MALVAMIACLFAFQNVSTVSGPLWGDGAVAAAAQGDCSPDPGDHPSNSGSHAGHCCLACNHRHADKLLFGFIVAFANVLATLSPDDSAGLAPFRTETAPPPQSGWAASWSPRAPPALS